MARTNEREPAASARLMDVFQNGVLVHHKIRHGPTQTVIVEQQAQPPCSTVESPLPGRLKPIDISKHFIAWT